MMFEPARLQGSDEGIIYCADIMHGGVAVLMCGVDEIVDSLLQKSEVEPSYKVNLELDGYTFEDWIRDPSPVTEPLSRAIKEGRVELVSGAYTQPFAENIGLESNIRQLQWGKELAREALGIDIETYLIQEHAYHTALPQMLTLLGYKYLVLRTHWSIWGQHKNYPYESFFWEGSDGSKILTIPAYEFICFGRVPDQPPRLDTWIQRRLASGVELPLAEEDIQRWLRAAREEGIEKPLASREPDLIASQILTDEIIKKIGQDPRLRFVTIAEYARMVEPTTEKTIAIPPDDMDTTLPFGILGDVINVGCKRAENLILTAEKLSTAAYLIAGRPVCNPDRMNVGGGQNYEDNLRFAWRKLMLAEQHDVWVCGPASTFGYSLADRGLKWLKQAEEIADEVIQESLVQILGCVGWSPPTEDALPILVCNQLSWDRSEMARVEVMLNKGEYRAVSIVDQAGGVVASQLVEAERYEDGSLCRVVVAFLAEQVPGIGYKVYYATGAEPVRIKTDLEASATRVSNSFLDVTLSEKGITGIALPPASVEAGRGAVGPVQLIPEGQVAAYLTALEGDKGRWSDTREGECRLELIESGPVYARYRIGGKTPAFQHVKTITVYSRAARIDVEESATFPDFTYLGHYTPGSEKGEQDDPGGGWHTDCFIEEEKLRAVVPISLKDTRVTRNVVYVPSETNRVDFSAYEWADVSDEEKGVALVNFGNYRYHYDKETGELSLVLGFSGTFLYTTTPDFHRMRGNYKYNYAILPHGRPDPAWNNRRALEANNPLLAVGTLRCRTGPGRARRGDLPQEGAFLKVHAPTGIVSTIKLERGQPVIRLFEDAGKTSVARLQFMKPVSAAYIVDLLGDIVQTLQVRDGVLELTLEPYKIVTIKLTLERQPLSSVMRGKHA